MTMTLIASQGWPYRKNANAMVFSLSGLWLAIRVSWRPETTHVLRRLRSTCGPNATYRCNFARMICMHVCCAICVRSEGEKNMAVPTAALRKARESAGIKQGDMAKRLGVSSNSVISRLEKSETTDRAMAERYLRAIGTEDSLAILDFYARDWRISQRPDFRHPDRESLWQAELALQKLAAFEAADEFDALLTAPLNFIRDTLQATADYVGRIDHALAW